MKLWGDHGITSSLFGGDDDGPSNRINPNGQQLGQFAGGAYGAGMWNPSPFRRGIDSETAFDVRKKAKRQFTPAMATLMAQDALLDPTMDLTRRAAAQYGDLWRDEATKAREYNADSLLSLGPRYRQAFDSMNPESAALLRLLTEDATGLVSGGSNPYEDRELTQSIRGAQAARGMGFGASDALGELLGLDRSRESRRMARGNYGAGIAALGKSYYSDAYNSLLGTGPQGSSIFSPVQGTSTDDLLSLGLNDTMQRRNQHAARVAGNQALWGSVMEMVGGLAGAAAGACWVAEVLYGVDDDRTHLARAWCLENREHPFVRLYRKHGKAWARWLEANDWARPMLQPIWDAMWQAQAGALIEKGT